MVRPAPQRTDETDEQFMSRVEELNRQWTSGEAAENFLSGPRGREVGAVENFFDRQTESSETIPFKSAWGGSPVFEAQVSKSPGSGFFSPGGETGSGQGRTDGIVWSGGSRDFDESTGTYRPGFRDSDDRIGIGDFERRQFERTRREEPVGNRADSFTRRIDRRGANRDERPSTRPILARDRVGVRPEGQTSASRLGGRRGGRQQFVGSRPTGTGSSFNNASSANPNQTGFRGFFNRVRDTITPSAYEYGGNIARSAVFRGGEQVNRTSFQDSDVQNLFERSDNIPVTVGPRTRFSDTKVYENEQGQLVPHTDETLKQFPPNARSQVTDYTGGPDLGLLENVPGVTPVRTAGSMLRYGYENPLGVRGESYIEYNQPDRFTSPTAEFSDAAYLNLKSDDPNETKPIQGLIGSAIHRLTGNKTDIVGTEFARASLPYERWSDDMKLQAGMPDFNQSMEMSDVFVDQYGNPKTDEQSRQLRQALLGTTAIGKEVSGSQRQRAADEFIAGIENWEPLTDQSTFEDIPEVVPAAKTETTNQVVSDVGTVNQFGEVVPSLGVKDGDDVAFVGLFGKKENLTGPATTKNRAGANEAVMILNGMGDRQKFIDKYGVTPSEYMNLPQAGTQGDQSFNVTGQEIAQVASAGDLSGLGATNQPATVDLNKSEVAGGQTLYGDTDYGLQEDGSSGVGDDDWGSGVDIDELEILIPGLELAQADPGEKFLDNYISPQQPYDEQIPVGNYIKNEDTGEVTQLADAPISGDLPSDSPQLQQQAKPIDTEPSTTGWDPDSDPGVIASDRAVDSAYAAYKAASTAQQNYLGGRTAGTQEEYNEYLRLAAISDAASKRLDAAYEQQARAMQAYTSSRS